MKDTIETIHLLEEMVAEKKVIIRAYIKDLGKLKEELRECKTHEEIDEIDRKLRELSADVDQHLIFIKRAKKRIAKFYAPAA